MTGDATVFFNLNHRLQRHRFGLNDVEIVNPGMLSKTPTITRSTLHGTTPFPTAQRQPRGGESGARRYVDMKLEITFVQVEAGEHTVYTRIIEEGVEIDDARYFDLPVKVVIRNMLFHNAWKSRTRRRSLASRPAKEPRVPHQQSKQHPPQCRDSPRPARRLGRRYSGHIESTRQRFLIINLPAYSSKDFSVPRSPLTT